MSKNRHEHSDSGRPEYLTVTNRLIIQKKVTESSELLLTLDQTDMVDIHQVFHPKTRKYKSFLQVTKLSST
jgi:hypothetical protein